MARRTLRADQIANKSDTREIPETPARSTRSTRNAYPNYTATPRTTRATAKKASDAVSATPTVKKTAIPARISIEQLPSPTRLRLKASGRRGKKNDDVNALREKIGSLDLDRKLTEQNARSARTTSTTKAADNMRTSKASTKAAEATSPDCSDDDNDEAATPETQDQVAAKVRKLVMDFQDGANSSRPSRLWEVESTDIEEVEAAIMELEETGNYGYCGVLRSMRAVIETFQGFRESFDEYLEAVDKCGLEVDWASEGGS